jgi:hypothetical protein
MKTLCFFAAVIALLVSCSKEPQNTQPEGPWWGEATAEKNGMLWKAKPYAFVNINHGNGLNVLIDSLDRDNLKREELAFYKVPFTPGTYPVVNTPPQVNDSLVGANFYYVEVDILYGVYKILEADSSSFITLTSYDTVSKEVKGTFDVTFIKEIKPYPSAPDTIRLRNGKFHTKVIK